MTNPVSLERAAQIATDKLAAQHLSPTYSLRADASPVLSKECIADLQSANRLKTLDGGLVDAIEVVDVFSATRVLNGVGLPVVRVSITPVQESGPCDLLDDFSSRVQTGWDFENTAGLSEDARWAGIGGVWPLSEESLRQAMKLNAFLLPSMKGFIDGSLIQRVTGYYLDLTTRRRWIKSRPLESGELRLILPKKTNGNDQWTNAWLTIPRGPTASFTNMC